MIKHVHVQLALPGKTCEGQVAATQVADDGVDGIIAKQQVELRVQRMTEEELDDDLLGAKLCGQLPQGPLVRVGRNSNSKLLAKLLGQLDFETECRLVVNAGRLVEQAQGFPELFVWETLHSNEDAAWAVVVGPVVHMGRKSAPTA